jgi:hypothetical protein
VLLLLVLVLVLLLVVSGGVLGGEAVYRANTISDPDVTASGTSLDWGQHTGTARVLRRCLVRMGA